MVKNPPLETKGNIILMWFLREEFKKKLAALATMAEQTAALIENANLNKRLAVFKGQKI